MRGASGGRGVQGGSTPRETSVPKGPSPNCLHKMRERWAPRGEASGQQVIRERRGEAERTAEGETQTAETRTHGERRGRGRGARQGAERGGRRPVAASGPGRHTAALPSTRRRHGVPPSEPCGDVPVVHRESASESPKAGLWERWGSSGPPAASGPCAGRRSGSPPGEIGEAKKSPAGADGPCS